MSGASFEVSGRPQSSDCKIKLNGEEIQSTLRGFTIRAVASEPIYRVELDVQVFDDLCFETQWANVAIPAVTRDLLIKMGWTPPTS